jgi:hypothetical protein
MSEILRQALYFMGNLLQQKTFGKNVGNLFPSAFWIKFDCHKLLGVSVLVQGHKALISCGKGSDENILSQA